MLTRSAPYEKSKFLGSGEFRPADPGDRLCAGIANVLV